MDISNIFDQLSLKEVIDNKINNISRCIKDLDKSEQSLKNITMAEPMIMPITNLPCYHIDNEAMEAIKLAIYLIGQKKKNLRYELHKNILNNFDNAPIDENTLNKLKDQVIEGGFPQ